MFNSNFLSKMTKSRFNWRNACTLCSTSVAKIGVACLAVCVMFASCGKDESVTYTLTVDVDPPNGGQVSIVPEKVKYDKGEKVTLTATAATGYTFEGWESGGTVIFNQPTGFEVTMDANKTYTAKFKSSGNGGTSSNFDISKLPANVEIRYGVSQVKTIIKVGDQYYRKTVWSGVLLEEVFLKKTGDTWTKYSKKPGENWIAGSTTFTSATVASAIVSNDFLGELVAPSSKAVENYNSPQAVNAGTEVIAGVSTNKKTLTEAGYTLTYWRDPVTNLFLKYQDGNVTMLECTFWNTADVSFAGISLP